MAFIASSSSIPSALAWSSVPRLAASIRTLRIDLASAIALPSSRRNSSSLWNPFATRTSFAAALACNPRGALTRRVRSTISLRRFFREALEDRRPDRFPADQDHKRGALFPLVRYYLIG